MRQVVHIQVAGTQCNAASTLDGDSALNTRVRKGSGTHLSPLRALGSAAGAVNACLRALTFPLVPRFPIRRSIDRPRTGLQRTWTWRRGACLSGRESAAWCASAVEYEVSLLECGASSGEKCVPAVKRERTPKRRFTTSHPLYTNAPAPCSPPRSSSPPRVPMCD
ncbi:hypothetical protein B0H12DRAFT_1238014 [Mycena haematopus]|nr:hypothetical protein B0H12DRAFT_1238014 [Mycena haematopus]